MPGFLYGFKFAPSGRATSPDPHRSFSIFVRRDSPFHLLCCRRRRSRNSPSADERRREKSPLRRRAPARQRSVRGARGARALGVGAAAPAALARPRADRHATRPSRRLWRLQARQAPPPPPPPPPACPGVNKRGCRADDGALRRERPPKRRQPTEGEAEAAAVAGAFLYRLDSKPGGVESRAAAAAAGQAGGRLVRARDSPLKKKP